MPVSYRRFAASVSACSILNEGTDEELICQGYCKSSAKIILYYASVVLTLGLILFVFKWKPEWGVRFYSSKCSLYKADIAVLKNKSGEKDVVRIIVDKVSRSFPSEFSYSPLNPSINQEYEITDRSDLTENEGKFFKYFIHRHLKYYWDYKMGRFKKLRGLDYDTLCADFIDKFPGLSQEQQAMRLLVYDENSICIEVKSYAKLFIEEVVNPFYVFQVFSIILWFLDNYYAFSACILIITSLSMMISLYEIRKQSQTLHDMVASADNVTVQILRRNKTIEEISSKDLVPGDVIIIPPEGCIMSCDAILIGGNCIANESMLTGESVPIMKTQIPHQDEPELYSPEKHKRYTLFCGTEIIQTRYYGQNNVTAVVVRTGFSTTKGELVRSILYPRPLGFKFYRDSIRFILVLFVIALGGIGYSLHIYLNGHHSIEKIVFRMLDIVTIVVPPTLPAAMTVGSIYAQSRLKKQKIFCTSPPRINVCGKIKLLCFDKTGTLTEDGLDLSGVVPIEQEIFQDMVYDPRKFNKRSPIIAAMATCHTLTWINGELRGDPMDLKMFQSTGWTIEEPGADNTRYDLLQPMIVHPSYLSLITSQDYMNGRTSAPYEIGIIRQFTFSSNLQRMSVIARILDETHMNLYVKGAPEKIVTLCVPDSVPTNFMERLESYTVKGYRVIALAWKPLDSKLTWHNAQKIKRADVEKDLILLGLLVLQNKLKPETTAVIQKLNSAKIRTIMATGDNMHTAISVARECGMIACINKIIIVIAYPPELGEQAFMKMEYANREDDNWGGSTSVNNTEVAIDVENGVRGQFTFCMSGKTFSIIRQYFPDYFYKIIVKGTVFARMSPDQKAQLVKELQEIGYLVGMCGDGANDCAALKTADVGISLSEAEASVAAPFTSTIPNIECVLIAIKEGRCALVTSFGVFKYMALYSMVQFISVLILYTCGTNLGDEQFLYIDLCLATIMALVMSYTKAFDDVVPIRPPGSLVSLAVIFSVISQILLSAAIQILAILFLHKQKWYIPTHSDYDDDFKINWDATVIFSVSTFQYVILAAVLSTGPPFRKPIYSNVWMIGALAIFTTANVIFLLHPFKWLADIFQLNVQEQFIFRLWLITLPVANVLLSIAIERLAKSDAVTIISRVLKHKTKPKNKYRQLENEIAVDATWLSVEQRIHSSVHV